MEKLHSKNMDCQTTGSTRTLKHRGARQIYYFAQAVITEKTTLEEHLEIGLKRNEV